MRPTPPGTAPWDSAWTPWSGSSSTAVDERRQRSRDAELLARPSRGNPIGCPGMARFSIASSEPR